MSLDARIARIAAKQFGVFALDQVLRAGGTRRMMDRRVEAGRWQRMHPRVLRLAGCPDDFRLRVMAACLACGAGAVASHASAAVLWQLDGVPEHVVEVSAPQRCRIAGVTSHFVSDLGSRDRSKIGAIPATSPARTLVDLAGSVDQVTLENALDDALRRNLVTLARLREAHDRLGRRGRKGTGTLLELLRARPDRQAVPDSPLETRVLRLIAKSGLPLPVLHYRVVEHGRTLAIVDLAYPDHRVAIELDGYAYHHGRVRWQADLTRMNALTSRGWRFLRFTYKDARRPDHVLGVIAAAITD